jgi:site-specific recombinase
VSFYLALRLALRAQDVSRHDHLEILRTLFHCFMTSPRGFFLPPAKTAVPSGAPTQSD